MTVYKGYSSHEYQTNKTLKLTDIELVNIDLLNHIFTQRGTRTMMPAFGTRIPQMAFEPLDDITIGIVESDLRYVVNFDPRVNLKSLIMLPAPDTNSLLVEIVLYYIELNMTDTLNLNILFEDQT